MSTKRKILLYLAITAFAATIIMVWLYRIEEQAAFAHFGNTAPIPLRVSVNTATVGEISQWVMSEGRAEAVRKSFIQFEEAGKVVFIGNDEQSQPLREGVHVFGPNKVSGSTGQLLARIDSRDKHSDVSQSEATYLAAQREIDMLRATMKQAEDSLVEAKQNHERKRILFEKKFLAKSEYDQARFRFTKATSALSVARLNIASAQARLNRARAELKKVSRSPEKLELRAPFDGIIGRMNIKVGDYFEPSDVVHANKSDLASTAPITIIDPTEMEITLHLPERDGRQVKTGQRVVVAPGFESWTKGATLDTAPKVNGVVYSVSPQIDGKRRAIRVKVRLHQEETTIPDGMFTSCWINVAHKEKGLRIPMSSLLYDGTQPYVFVFKEDTAQRRNLTIGLRNSHSVEILSGLKKGDLVVSGGRKKLVDGTPIALVKTTTTEELRHD